MVKLTCTCALYILLVHKRTGLYLHVCTWTNTIRVLHTIFQRNLDRYFQRHKTKSWFWTIDRYARWSQLRDIRSGFSLRFVALRSGALCVCVCFGVVCSFCFCSSLYFWIWSKFCLFFAEVVKFTVIWCYVFSEYFVISLGFMVYNMSTQLSFCLYIIWVINK